MAVTDSDESLFKLLAEANPRFTPYAHYVKEADCLHFYARDVEMVGVRIDEVLTVFEGLKDREFAGCLIKGVRRLLREVTGPRWIEVYPSERTFQFPTSGATLVLLARE